MVEFRDHACWITINREQQRNALNAGVVQMIGEAIEKADSTEDCLAVVLTGAGSRAFCAGADLKKGTDGFAFAVDYSEPRHYLVTLFRQMQACRLPIIGRINGHAMAGGFGLLCACDMAIATDDVLLGTPETKIGMAPMMILPWMLRVLPARKLMEMCITGEPVSALEALEMGVLNYVVPRDQLDLKLDWLLARIVDKSPTAVRLGKQAANAMRDMSMFESLEYAQVMVSAMASTNDAKEGMAAFAEKRRPCWSGT